MLLPPLILKGVLFLSIAQPIEVPLKSNQLWFSKQDVVTAQVLGNRVALKAAKEGIVFASGLGLAGSLQKIMAKARGVVLKIVKTHKGLKQCWPGKFGA